MTNSMNMILDISSITGWYKSAIWNMVIQRKTKFNF